MSESASAVTNGNGYCETHLKYKALDIPEVLEPEFVYPDLPSKCTWVQDKSQQEPTVHTVRPL